MLLCSFAKSCFLARRTNTLKQMSAANSHKSDSKTETSRWDRCRPTNAQSSRLFVVVVGVVFIIIGCVLLWQYSRVHLRDFLVLGVGMLVVGVVFIVLVTLFAFMDECKSFVKSVGGFMSPQRVGESHSQLEPTLAELAVPKPCILYQNRPTSRPTDGRKLSGRDPKAVRINVGPNNLQVAEPRHSTSDI